MYRGERAILSLGRMCARGIIAEECKCSQLGRRERREKAA